MHDAAATTFRWAWHLLDGFAATGVGCAVISPGSRSTPLALAALRHPGLSAHVIIDERAAAFFALGLAKASGLPVILIATSGSAVANWFPAVVEADMGRVPLLLLSADRPPELQDCGANQTMDQIGLFGSHVRACHQLPPAAAETGWLSGLAARSVAASLGPLPGPVHLNIPLREPLVPADMPELTRTVAPPCRLTATRHPDPDSLNALAKIVATGPGAIVCGPEPEYPGSATRTAVVELASRLGVPIFADILSSLRCGTRAQPHVLAHPDQVARTAPAPGWILRLGGTPLSRATNGWLEKNRGAAQIVLANHPRSADPTGTATHRLHADPALLCHSLAGPSAPAHWLARFLDLDRAAETAAMAACAAAPVFEGALLRALLHALPADTPLFLGNSLTVRAADWFAGRSAVPLRLFGNRGVSGIDGNLSTAGGIAAACGPTVAVVGDLSCLHDLTALALCRQHRVTVLLLDNGGGGIFDHLPQAGLPEFEQGWLTPQAVDFASAAHAFGLPCLATTDMRTMLDAVLDNLRRGAGGLIHVRIDRQTSHARIQAFHQGV